MSNFCLSFVSEMSQNRCNKHPVWSFRGSDTGRFPHWLSHRLKRQEYRWGEASRRAAPGGPRLSRPKWQGPRVAGDPRTGAPRRRRVGVSIHARAWRATRRRRRGSRKCWFQFTPARGGRPPVESRRKRRNTFQFTPARGGRPPYPIKPVPHGSFQFTPARGGRLSQSRKKCSAT